MEVPFIRGGKRLAKKQEKKGTVSKLKGGL
jgi:hypothetical protein